MVRKGGIYKIQSIVRPDRLYVGSAVYFASRWGVHRMLLRNGKHHSKKLQRHYDKHGEADLQFVILLECPRTSLLREEQKFIDELRPFFNCSPTAGSQFGFKQSESAKLKNSINKKGNKYWVGKKHSEESKAKMRIAKLGRKLSAETRAKLSILRIGNKCAVGSRPKLGIHLSEQAKTKISEGLKRYFANKRMGDANCDLFG